MALLESILIKNITLILNQELSQYITMLTLFHV